MTVTDLARFVLVLVRVGTMWAFLPFLGEGFVPVVGKALGALVISIVLFPAASGPDAVILGKPVSFLLLVVAEGLFGALLGFGARTIFSVMTNAGQLISRQMGMALAVMADPVTGVETTVVASFCQAVGVLVFFGLNGHHWMLGAIHRTLREWPIGTFVSPQFLKALPLAAVVQSFVLAFQLAAPLLLLTFLVGLVMALMARLVPEVNILVIGFPLRVGAGLLALAFFMPWFVHYCGRVCNAMGTFLMGFPVGS